MSKKSFILHIDSLSILDKLNFEQKGILFDAIYKYNLGINIELDFALDLVFTQFKNQFDRDLEKYENIVERNKNNGSKGGRPKKPKKPKLTQKTEWVILKPKKADNDNDNDSDNKKEILFNKWIHYRNEIKHKLTDTSIESLRKKFDEYDYNSCLFVIENSINNGWQGLFWDKVPNKNNVVKLPEDYFKRYLSEEQKKLLTPLELSKWATEIKRKQMEGYTILPILN
jgi:hypothetical protein